MASLHIQGQLYQKLIHDFLLYLKQIAFKIKNDNVIVIALFIGSPLIEDQHQIDELERLINTLGGVVIDKIIQYRKKIDPKFYIGKGKLDFILKYAIQKKIKRIVINNDISPSHIKNIQSYFKDKVFIKDRVGIILDIFDVFIVDILPQKKA